MIIVLITTTLAVGIAACGSESADSGRPAVLATTGILADITANLAGPGIDVEQLIPDGSSPHDFQLSAKDRQRLEEADLVVENGAGLEATLPLDDVDTARWALADHVGELLVLAEGGGDPHVWMDPARVVAALPSLADSLAAADPAHAAEYHSRAAGYTAELRRLDREVRRELAGIQADERELVTSHDALGYLADRYGLEVVATAFPASGPEAEASADQLRDLADAIAERGVPAVFAGEEDDPEALQTVADEAGVEVVDDLYIESPGEAGTYAGMLNHDAERIAGALSR